MEELNSELVGKIQIINSELTDKSLEYNLRYVRSLIKESHYVVAGIIRPITPNQFYIMFVSGNYCTAICYTMGAAEQPKVLLL